MASTHPHFDDRGNRWHTKLADALAQAKAENKHVLVEYGRSACGNCRALVQNVMSHAAVKAELDAHFVLLAADCDKPEADVRAIGAKNMSRARSLPFVMYLNADGVFVHGTEGARDLHGFMHDLLHGREDHHPH
jgi:thiol:disulfide interchange protein